MKKKTIHLDNKSWTIFHLEHVESTMLEIKKNIFCEHKNLAIYADSQSKGVGRNSKSWISEKGNLFLSLKIKSNAIQQFFIFNYIFGLTVFDAVSYYINSDENIYIKWPNDIILNNKKVAGILIELSSIGKKIDTVYAGIGINISHSPSNVDYKTTFLKAFVKNKIALLDTIKVILEKLSFWENYYLINGSNQIISEWMKRSHDLGSDIKFKEHNKVIEGVYKGIDKDGSIKICIKNKLFKFYNTEVLI